MAYAQAQICSVPPSLMRAGAVPPSLVRAGAAPPRRVRWGTPALVCLLGTLLASGIAMAVERKHAPPSEPGAPARATRPPTALPRAEPPEIASELPLDTLLAAYSDPVRVAAPFHGRLVRTRGEVQRVRKTVLGDLYVLIGGTRAYRAGRLECVVPRQDVPRAAALSRGDQVEVVGRIVDAGLDIVARECRLVDVQHAAGSATALRTRRIR